MSDHVTAFDHIPVVDIEPFLHGDHPARVAVANEVARACETVGFLYVRGHGVEEAVLRRAAAAARDFFALPAELKQQVHMDHAPNHRGYVWTNDRFASTSHRVVHTGESARQSIAFFGNCDYHTPVECLPSCQDAGNPPRYAPTTVGEHLLASVQHAYGYVGAYGDTQEVRQP